MKVIINSCLLTELLKNFQTSLDNMRVIGETYSVEDMNEQYEILKNWEKVAQHFGLTRRIIQGIRKKDS